MVPHLKGLRCVSYYRAAIVAHFVSVQSSRAYCLTVKLKATTENRSTMRQKTEIKQEIIHFKTIVTAMLHDNPSKVLIADHAIYGLG